MPRPKATSTATRTRSGTTRVVAIARPTGQLVWAGAPPGGTSFELYQAANGAWQLFLLTNTNGIISRSLMKPKDVEVMQFIQAYLTQFPPIALRNRSIARNAANTIPANGVGASTVGGTAAVKRRARTRVSVNRTAAAVS